MADYPIEELAHRAGMSVRNVRTYVSRGLLPPARMAGRAARYTDEHLDRLDLVNGLRRRGFTLGAIEVLVRQDPDRAAEDALRLYRGMLAPWRPEEPVEIDEDALAGWMGLPPEALEALRGDPGDAGPGTAGPGVTTARLREAGLVEPAGPGRIRILRPDLVRAGGDAVRLGIPLEAVLTLREHLDEHTGRIAELFVELFAEQVWAGYVRDGLPAEGVPRIQTVVEGLQPVATTALLSSFRARMQSTMDAFIERISGEISESAAADAARLLGPRGTERRLDDR
ncbi:MULTISPECIES: MerR family transcriptional regulator [unclassified Pseudonocardia]|uniref:MerR family transcriptional regulator n=1 Tax=unclassified Pseudonocardia TaxID=2619320 RepID=UPI0001FFEC1D|nr:MerR family transcriptional regulator [Pseudonocardia sp. Ae707_Ps1]OLM17507.1 putative transcription regulator protein [Pseudonocardia sp. Ae707_Ps1]